MSTQDMEAALEAEMEGWAATEKFVVHMHMS